MRVPRIYLPELPAAGATTELTGQAQHYLINVLRLEAGRPLRVFDGQGREGEALVQAASKRSCTVLLVSLEHISRESPLDTHLAIGVSKGDRFEWVLQKATELGVSRITPLWTERTEVRLKGDRLSKKHEHWQQILISACEQCQRNQLPHLYAARPLSDLLAERNDSLKLILHPGGSHGLGGFAPPAQLTLLIGPEGGLSEQETQQALAQQYQPLALGPRILRTETAPLAVLACAQMLWGDLG